MTGQDKEMDRNMLEFTHKYVCLFLSNILVLYDKKDFYRAFNTGMQLS